MDRYEVMAGKMTPLTDGAHRKWGFTGKVETRSYERLVDALIDFVETGDGLKARCPACKRPAHIAKRDETFYFVDDEYNPFVRHAPVKTTEAVFRFFANGYRREHGTEPEVTGNRKLSERDILSGMGAVPTKTDLGKR